MSVGDFLVREGLHHRLRRGQLGGAGGEHTATVKLSTYVMAVDSLGSEV